jgi:ribosome-associated translation inhibitor RaiA
MIIQLNTDRNISGNERLEDYLNSVISEELSRFSDNITRVEVHLSDENGAKSGDKDIRCVLEARLSNKKPVAVTSHADAIEKAVSDALAKLKATLSKK